MPTQPTYCWLHSTYSVGARYETVQALLSVLPTFVSSPNFCQFTQLLSVFPTYYTLGCTKEPRGFWGLVAVAFTHVGAECVGGPWDFEGFLFFFDAPDNTSLFKIEESIILWDHPQSLCQFSHRTKTIRTIKFPLQLYSVHRSAGGKTGTVCLPAKIFFFGIKICWI